MKQTQVKLSYVENSVGILHTAHFSLFLFFCCCIVFSMNFKLKEQGILSQRLYFFCSAIKEENARKYETTTKSEQKYLIKWKLFNWKYIIELETHFIEEGEIRGSWSLLYE